MTDEHKAGTAGTKGRAWLAAVNQKWREFRCAHVLRSWGYSYGCTKCGGSWGAH